MKIIPVIHKHIKFSRKASHNPNKYTFLASYLYFKTCSYLLQAIVIYKILLKLNR